MTDITKKILLTLAPADYYFFGGENTFDTDTTGVRNYLVRSNRLPQQTALVGLIRHILLLNGKKIGKESFRADLQEEVVQSFGALHGLSPLFLQESDGKTRQFLLPAPKTLLKNGAEIHVNLKKSIGKGRVSGHFRDVPQLFFEDPETKEEKTWTEKEHLGDYWISLSDGSKKLAADIFISSLHVGIDKGSRMKTNGNDDEAFYKQEFRRLASGYRFALVAEVDTSLDISIFNTAMPFGGENRTFSVCAENWTSELEQKWKPVNAYSNCPDRIVLTSDAWVEDDGEALYDLCQLVISGAKPFRNIYIKKAEYSKQVFANLHHKKQALTYLLERGSVLFPLPEKETEVMDLLSKPENFQNIGYNYFHPHQFLI
jgi:CRISPR-associated protein Cmr3